MLPWTRLSFLPLQRFLDNPSPRNVHYGPVVVLTVEGKTGNFLLDTGSAESWVRRSALKTNLKTKESVLPEQRVSLGEASLTLAFNVVEDTRLDKMLLGRLDGILGCDALQQVLLGLDFSQQQLTLAPVESDRQELLSGLGYLPGRFRQVELYGQAESRPFVDLLIDERFSDLALVDTGTAGSLVAHPEAVRAKPTSARQPASQRDWEGKSSVALAPFSFGVSAYQQELPFVTLRYRGQDTNLLGTDFLSAFEVLFDLPKARLYLKPTRPTVKTRPVPLLPSLPHQGLVRPQRGDEAYLADRALNLTSAARYTDALETLVLLEQLDPGSKLLWHYRGIALWLSGKPKEAAVALQRAAERAPQQPRIWRNLGNVLKELGREAEAESAFARAKALSLG